MKLYESDKEGEERQILVEPNLRLTRPFRCLRPGTLIFVI